MGTRSESNKAFIFKLEKLLTIIQYDVVPNYDSNYIQLTGDRCLIGKQCLIGNLLKSTKKLADLEIEAYMFVKAKTMKQFAYVSPLAISTWIQKKKVGTDEGMSRAKPVRETLGQVDALKQAHKEHPNGLAMVVHHSSDHWYTVILHLKEDIWEFLVIDSAGKPNAKLVSGSLQFKVCLFTKNKY